MISIRSEVRWVLIGLLLPAGVACLGGDRDAPEWELIFGLSSSGASSSGVNTSSGTGGTTSSGTGGTTSSGTGGTTSSGTGGAGGAVVVCDGSGDCATCFTCALGPCDALWTACQADVDCPFAIACINQCGLTNIGDVTGYDTCVANCALSEPGYSQALSAVTCRCQTECPADCEAELPFDCSTQI